MGEVSQQPEQVHDGVKVKSLEGEGGRKVDGRRGGASWAGGAEFRDEGELGRAGNWTTVWVCVLEAEPGLCAGATVSNRGMDVGMFDRPAELAVTSGAAPSQPFSAQHCTTWSRPRVESLTESCQP